MKPEIHPKYHDAAVRCACGNEFTVGSTKTELKLDICSACHPFFTGKQKFVDTAGRVDKYMRKYGDEAQTKFKKKKKIRRVIRDEADIQALLAEPDEVTEDASDDAPEAAPASGQGDPSNN